MRVRTMWEGLTFRTLWIGYVALDAALALRVVLDRERAPSGLGTQAFWLLLDLFLLWRIVRGSRPAWVFLLLLTALPVPLVLLFSAASLNPQVFVLFAISLLQVALLSHPAMRHRVRPMPASALEASER